ncbi:MAG: FAD-dependent oxidoreductase, partial [Deltaproteobacteria bacterium]|nr:FAD-dependent oxidoreductase [Deltaproteobacteria bacterium]
MGRDAEAIDVIRKDNPFPWVCGLVCTRPCEFMCVRGRIDEPVSIKFLKAFAAERAMSERLYRNPDKDPDKGQKVCIIGAGPAGMSAAYYLALKGYGVTVIEALPVAELKAEGFEAFFFAIGAHKSFQLNIPGEKDYPQVLQAIDVLRRVALGERKIPGKKVVVIGGGNVAIDAARTCLRLGCDPVTLAYRRTRAEMPADIEEVEQAEEEGIHISFLTIPAEILGENNRVTALRCIRAEMVAQEGGTRKYPVPVEGSDYLIEADAVISAIGQQVDPDCLASLPELKWTRRNTLDASKVSMETAIPGVFAAGDAVTGPATIIEAIGGGKRAADAIDRYLSGIPQPKMPPV